MSARKPPAHVYNDTATLRVCTTVDRYQQPTYCDYALQHVNVQPTNETARSADNTEVVLRMLMFADAVYTTPSLDLFALSVQSNDAGAPMQIVHRTGTYTVVSVDEVRDEYGDLDHYEVTAK